VCIRRVTPDATARDAAYASIACPEPGAITVYRLAVPPKAAARLLEAKVKNPALLDLDRKALEAGRLYIGHAVAIGAVTQADGFAQ